VTWCDKLAATPGIGVLLNKSFAPVASLLEPLAPVVSRWVDKDNDRPAFSIDGQDAFGGSLTTFDGYQYVVGPEQFAVEFKHRMRLKPQSAGPPIAEMLSKPLPYTELFPQITERLLEMLRLVITAKQSRKLLRIGIITTTYVALDDAPPGIRRFLKHVTKPWGIEPEFFNIDVTAKLAKGKNTAKFDRCLHLLQRLENSDNDLLLIRLDWQRYFEPDKTFSASSLPDLIEAARRDALAYFEDIGQGERFDD
jgi:hypothetical protein